MYVCLLSSSMPIQQGRSGQPESSSSAQQTTGITDRIVLPDAGAEFQEYWPMNFPQTVRHVPEWQAIAGYGSRADDPPDARAAYRARLAEANRQDGNSS